MKKLFLLMILIVVLMLRFSLSVRVTEIFQKEVYRMNLSLEDGKIKVLKINNKYLLKNIYGKLGYKESGKYEGYFLVKSIKEYENIYFVELEDVKSTKIEDNFLEKYLQILFNRAEEDYSYGIKNINRAILLGDNTRIRKDLKDKIRYIGLSHIFAMSGLHIALVIAIFYFIFKKTIKNKKVIEILLLVSITLYYISVKESPSFTRAYIMAIVYLLGKLFYEKVDLGKALFISAIVSILINPTVIFSISFQLSYGAMIAIIYIFPYTRKINYKKLKILDYILFTTTIQIFLMPITVYYFNTIQFLSVISNLILLSLASFYITVNYIALFLENFYLSFLLKPIVEIMYKILIYLIDFFSELPYLSVEYESKKMVYVYIVLFIIIIFYKNLKIKENML
ncbi:ComEC/Rec2 family competence protein [Fusobacterium nucleatum]|uniref:ComEC/Rec2 family competence protein n=2 Tax=Fusobacterium nucleatum TaxID=851 RepID=UPI00201AD367|nr:ComEC/Rec2 family competence protein [Fusobacterium nucleatum]MCL4575644.1 competence protein ComE [Fusobacterium nucleatum YWH7056]MCL4582622.1 competence protein ComE [Fusobacterium nucleatum YWH7054]